MKPNITAEGAVTFAKFIAAAIPELAALWESAGRDNAAALRLAKRAFAAARERVDEALAKKHGAQ